MYGTNQRSLQSRWQPSAPPVHYGGFAPTFACHPVKRHQRRAYDFRGHRRSVRDGTSARGSHSTLGSNRLNTPRGTSPSRFEPVANSRAGAIGNLHVQACYRTQTESAAARSGLTLAGATDGKPAIHRLEKYQATSSSPCESRASFPSLIVVQASRSGHFDHKAFTAVEPLGYVRPSHVACGSPVQASFLPWAR